MESALFTPFIERVKLRLTRVKKDPISKDHLVSAAVMLLLFEKNGRYHIILNKRSQQVEHHKGEIAFPGGVFDREDKDFEETALRETWEEMGIRQDHVTVLGQLSELETRTNFRIVPFVSTFRYPYRYKTNPTEVEQVLEVPISHLQDPKNQWRELDEWLGRPRMEHFYCYQGHVIYGATARVLHQFLALIS